MPRWCTRATGATPTSSAATAACRRSTCSTAQLDRAHRAVGQRDRRRDLAGRKPDRRGELHAGRHPHLRRAHARAAVRSRLDLRRRHPARQGGRASPTRPATRFVFSLFEAGEIWVVDASEPRAPKVTKLVGIGKQPYDGFITPNGRHYIAGLYGEDGLALVDLWNLEQGARKILAGYGRGEAPLPVYKMPHLRGWAVAGRLAFLPAIGRHEVLVVDTETWREAGRVKVHGQPVFAVAQPGGRQVWVNFAFPHNGVVQVIDVPTLAVVKQLQPGRAVLHLEFTPRGEQVWISSRDDNVVVVYDTASYAERVRIAAERPSGIFLTARALRTGF